MKNLIFISSLLIAGVCFYVLYNFIKPEPFQLENTSDLSTNNTSVIFPKIQSGEENYSHLKIYIVSEGDNLSLIADKNNITVSQLLKINKLANADMIEPGTELILPEFDQTTGKILIFYSRGKRDIASKNIESEGSRYFKESEIEPDQSTIIYNDLEKACIKYRFESKDYYLYLTNYNNDWQIYAEEVR